MAIKTKVKAPDLSSVKTLTSVKPTALARHLGLTLAAIYTWQKTNRIPARHLIKVATFYDVELGALMHLASSDTPRERTEKIKPRATLPAALRVQRGEISLEDAALDAGASVTSLRAVVTTWGEKLQTLYDTLEALDRGEIKLAEAAQRLGVVLYRVHNIRRSYGYAPGVSRKAKAPATKSKRDKALEAALDAIAGLSTAEQASENAKVSRRTVDRRIEELTPHNLHALCKWPASFRRAYADEIRLKLAKNEQNSGENAPFQASDAPFLVENWLKTAEEMRLVLKKRPKNLPAVADWKVVPLRRMLIAVLTGEATLEEVAVNRGGDAGMIANLFTSDLRPLGTSYEQVMALGFNHQMALADLLTWTLDRARRAPE